jgi:hypothetical protein
VRVSEGMMGSGGWVVGVGYYLTSRLGETPQIRSHVRLVPELASHGQWVSERVLQRSSRLTRVWLWHFYYRTKGTCLLDYGCRLQGSFRSN